MNLRLFDAVVVAAIGLLSLKAIGYLGHTPSQDPMAAAGQRDELAERRDFGRVLAKARAGLEVRDPEVTGSVPASKPEGKGPEARAEAPDGKAIAAMPPGAGTATAERSLLESLAQRREELDKRARELETRERLLETAEKRLEARLGEIKLLEDKVTVDDRAKAAAEQQSTKNLVVMYEAMKPKDAARVFDRLGHDVLVPIVTQMNARKVADVLAAMSPEAAQKLTTALAGRGRPKGEAGRPQPDVAAGELPAVDAPTSSRR